MLNTAKLCSFSNVSLPLSVDSECLFIFDETSSIFLSWITGIVSNLSGRILKCIDVKDPVSGYIELQSKVMYYVLVVTRHKPYRKKMNFLVNQDGEVCLMASQS